MIKNITQLFLFSFFLLGCDVNAKIVEQSEHHFYLEFQKEFILELSKINDQVLSINQWWSPQHTYSGNSENLFLDTQSKHCFCESLDNGGMVSHLQVVNYQPEKLIRLIGGLGPLQSIPLNGVMDFNFEKLSDSKTKLKLTYKVNSAQNLKSWVEPVHFVLSEQFTRLVQLLEK